MQVPMVMEELVACDSKVQEALADTLEVVQEITQVGPHTFHRVAVHTWVMSSNSRRAIKPRDHCDIQVAFS